MQKNMIYTLKIVLYINKIYNTINYFQLKNFSNMNMGFKMGINKMYINLKYAVRFQWKYSVLL
jgi:hypothetical protein